MISTRLLTVAVLFLCNFVFSDSLHTTRSIAVIDFRGDGLEQGVANNFSNKFRKLVLDEKQFNVMERDNMNAILKEQGFQQSGCTSTECVVDVGRLIGVNSIVAGGVGKVGLLYIINARLINVETGKIEREADFSDQISIEEFYSAYVDKLYSELFLVSQDRMLSNKSRVLFKVVLGSEKVLRKDSLNTSNKLETISEGTLLPVYAETRYYYYVKSASGLKGFVDKAWTTKKSSAQ